MNIGELIKYRKSVRTWGTGWIGHFDQDACRKLLGAPEGWNVVQLLPLGYPADPQPVVKSRKEVRGILNWNKWER